jgi:hypothetical protein
MTAAMKNTQEDSRSAPIGDGGKKDKNMIIVMLAMFAAGIFMLALGGYEIKGSRETSNWPSITGTITSSSVRTETRRESNKTSTVYFPNVQYRYKIDGQPYTSSRIAFGNASGGRKSFAQDVVEKYPSGQKITVYYDPDDPQYAILETGFTWNSIFIFLGGIVFFAAGVLCLKTYLRSKQKQG